MSQRPDISTFAELEQSLAEQGRRLLFAMNAGMYHADRSPVGLLVEQGTPQAKLNTQQGMGNFFLLPNGVFAAHENTFAVRSTPYWKKLESPGPIDLAAWRTMLRRGDQEDEAIEWLIAKRSKGEKLASQPIPYAASQSGPLLLKGRKLHPSLNPDSTNRLIRNGVGVNSYGDALFAISTTPVTFHEFARFFEMLGCHDALYLDGTVSALYAPELNRHDSGEGLGPVVFVTEPAN